MQKTLFPCQIVLEKWSKMSWKSWKCPGIPVGKKSGHPAEIPFPAIQENIPKLENWLLTAFKSTAFNITLPYLIDPLPKMSGEPQKINLRKDAIPYAVLTPIPIPHYWKEEVEQQLMNDVKMGILRPAPLNEPSE